MDMPERFADHPCCLTESAVPTVTLYTVPARREVLSPEPRTMDARSIVVALAAIAFVPLSPRDTTAGDWSNSGGNGGRNGRSVESGPSSPVLAWSGAPSSIIAWQPVTSGPRAFMVRQTGFPPGGEPNGSPVVAFDLGTGAVLWTRHVPYVAGDWTTFVAGASRGLVYCSRAGNGGSVAAKLHALDEATGATVWTSSELIRTGAYDGVVFAKNGDPIVAWHQRLVRIRATDGTTVWSVPRTGSVSGNCGAAVHGDAVYVADVAPGGHVIKRFDLATGAFQYQSSVMLGFTLQNTPLVGPDGTVYLSRTQNNPVTDFFYAFTDTGAALVEKWKLPAGWSTSSEFGIGVDGSVYVLAPGNVLQRLDPATGAVLQTSVSLGASSVNPRIAIDAQGRLFVGNGGFATGAVYSFDPDLALRWSIPVTNINIGGPVLGAAGTLLVAGIGGDVRAFRTGDSPWSDLGHALAGALGAPTLTGTGTLAPASPLALRLEYARPNTTALFFVGASAVNLPLAGGILVPAPDVMFALATDATGAIPLLTTWPPFVPSGAAIHMQYWIVDPEGPQGFAASNALRLIAP
jgi:hypothetical protein